MDSVLSFIFFLIVEQTRMTQKRVSGDVGDYVEYEEIKVSRETESGTDADASGREPQQK